MPEKSPYQIPEFLNQALNDGQPFSGRDEKAILDIFAAADKFEYPDARAESNWEALKSRIENPLTVTKKPARQFPIYRWAAAAIVVLGLCIGLWQYKTGGNTNFTAAYKTGANSQVISLPDHSTVELNANSELLVKCISDKERQVVLVNGEAYFVVTHNDLPFTVETNKGTVSVVGTEFNVRNRQDKPFSVALRKGKIRFQNPEGEIELHPGECVKEDKNGNLVVGTVNIEKQFPFRNDNLTFDGVALSEIIKELEDHYGVKFTYEHALDNERVKISFKENMNAVEAAKLLSATLGSKVP